MELFTNAMVITLGIAGALFAVYVTWVCLRLLLLFLDKAATNARKKQAIEARQERDAKRAARVMQLVTAELENTDVHFIVTQLMQHPYMEPRTRAAKENNRQRNKLLAELRKLVADPEVRRVLYTGGMAA